VTRGDLNRKLVRRFPELVDGYLEAKRLWGGEEPGPHVVYGDVLVPFIRMALVGRTSHNDLAPVMEFLEGLSATTDSETLDVVVTSVLEPLLDDEHRVRFEDAMGPRTRKLWTRLVADTTRESS
jgi:hypothetical protein